MKMKNTKIKKEGIEGLLEACHHGRLKKVKEFLDNGVDPTPTNIHDNPLATACAYGHIDVVKLLLSDNRTKIQNYYLSDNDKEFVNNYCIENNITDVKKIKDKQIAFMIQNPNGAIEYAFRKKIF